MLKDYLLRHGKTEVYAAVQRATSPVKTKWVVGAWSDCPTSCTSEAPPALQRRLIQSVCGAIEDLFVLIGKVVIYKRDLYKNVTREEFNVKPLGILTESTRKDL